MKYKVWVVYVELVVFFGHSVVSYELSKILMFGRDDSEEGEQEAQLHYPILKKKGLKGVMTIVLDMVILKTINRKFTFDVTVLSTDNDPRMNSTPFLFKDL
ncbi:hypothetical protein ACTFIV_010526 [Dictyostelium citrinum]